MCPGILVKLADLTLNCLLNYPGCPHCTQSTEAHTTSGPGEKSNKITWTHDHRSPCSTSGRGHSPLSQHFTSAGQSSQSRYQICSFCHCFSTQLNTFFSLILIFTEQLYAWSFHRILKIFITSLKTLCMYKICNYWVNHLFEFQSLLI